MEHDHRFVVEHGQGVRQALEVVPAQGLRRAAEREEVRRVPAAYLRPAAQHREGGEQGREAGPRVGSRSRMVRVGRPASRSARMRRTTAGASAS
ncbi:hypothetical protein AMK30_09650 [Streptomyces sp. CB02460]|nr:hypothetical protein AMK30_09650 [Streptomyces sp. CB02460]